MTQGVSNILFHKDKSPAEGHMAKVSPKEVAAVTRLAMHSMAAAMELLHPLCLTVVEDLQDGMLPDRTPAIITILIHTTKGRLPARENIETCDVLTGITGHGQ